VSFFFNLATTMPAGKKALSDSAHSAPIASTFMREFFDAPIGLYDTRRQSPACSRGGALEAARGGALRPRDLFMAAPSSPPLIAARGAPGEADRQPCAIR